MDIDRVELDQTEMTSAKATDVRSQTNWPFTASQIQFSRLSVSAQHKLQHFCYIFVLLVPQHIHLMQQSLLDWVWINNGSAKCYARIMYAWPTQSSNNKKLQILAFRRQLIKYIPLLYSYNIAMNLNINDCFFV